MQIRAKRARDRRVYMRACRGWLQRSLELSGMDSDLDWDELVRNTASAYKLDLYGDMFTNSLGAKKRYH